MTASEDDPKEPAAFVRFDPMPDHVVLEYHAVVAADLLKEAHEAYLHAAASAERFVINPPADASAAAILAEWSASNSVRREIMRLSHERGQNLISAINTMLALD